MKDNLTVRDSLAGTITRKEGIVRRLDKDAASHRRELAEIKIKRDARQAEIDSLREHLDSLGGPVEKKTSVETT